MKKILMAAAAAGTTATAAVAGGVERNNQSVGVIFEEGRYLEFGGSIASPDVSGSLFGLNSGNITETFTTLGGAYKADINNEWAYAIILNQPFGADVAYPAGNYPFAGSTAKLRSNALTGIIKYRMPSNVSIYGGLRLQSLSANAALDFPAALLNPSAPPGLIVSYTGDAKREYEVGYLFGAAYERPDIALRVSLTYNSAIDYDLGTVETLAGSPEQPSTTKITTPQSLHLEFRTGIAADTLLFGGVRWVEWTKFSIAPQLYTGAVGSPLVFFEDDRTTFTLGLGRRLNEKWSLAGSLNYEARTGSLTGNLGPTDGFIGGTLAAVYTTGNTEITTGISYVAFGDATTRINGLPGASFTNNDAVGVGVKVGYKF